MQKKLTQGKQSNYEIQLTFTKDDEANTKDKVLKQFQKDVDVQGFRKGQVPLDMVEKQIKPEYIQMGIYEELVNKGIQNTIDENTEIRFIGEPYELDRKEEKDEVIITFKLDVFPEVIVKKDDWKKIAMKEIKIDVTQEEIDQAIMQLKKNYADYKDTDTIETDTTSKVKVEFLDKKGASLESRTLFLGEPEFTEGDFFTKNFVGKKKDETFEIAYKEKEVSPKLAYTKDGEKPTKMSCTPVDIKTIILPELTPANIKKFFGKDAGVKDEKGIIAEITKSIEQQKFEQALVQQIEEYIKNIREKSMEVGIPKTLIEEEHKTRLKSLHDRFGGEENMKKYFEQMGEEKSKAFLDDIKKAAGESLEKFFILQKVTQELALDVNRNNPGQFEIEKKLYEKLTGTGSKEIKKATTKKSAPKKKENKK